MDNRSFYVIEEGEHSNRDVPSPHKLHKQERNLLERLREAQEAEARALERFQRAQAKLERRKARIQRLEQRLSRLKEEQAELEAGAGESLDEQPTTNGYAQVDARGQDVLASAAPVDTPLPESVPEHSSVEEEAAFEAEVSVAPELQPSPEPSEMTAQAGEQSEQKIEPSPEPTEVIAQASEQGEQEEQEEQDEAKEGDAQVAQEEQVALSDETQPIQRVQPVAEAEVAAVVAEDAGVSESAAVTASTKSPEQVLAEAKEVWQMADAAVNLARNRAQDLATSISILGQANLSSILMEELLHKQADANKALVEAQRSARVAYEELVAAEETYRASKQQQEE